MSEENKYNIKLNPKKPSPNEIKGKMDFEGAYKAYTHKAYRSSRSGFQRHSFRNRKVSMFIILTIVIGTLVFIENEKEFEENVQPEQIDNFEKTDSLKLSK